MISLKTSNAFLALIRCGIGHSFSSLPNEVDWIEIQALASEQGLSAVAIDGIEKIQDNLRPPKAMLLEWIGEVLQGYDYRYKAYVQKVASLAKMYNSHGYKMMVLKGYACAINWPKPEHRPSGDIDIWLFGKQEEADKVLAKENGIKIDKAHHHHTVFDFGGETVENHYDFINVHHHKSNAGIEAILKELGQDDSNIIDLYGEKVFLPSPNLHALLLLKHTMMHFAAEGITLRQLMDWGFHAKAHNGEIDWQWLTKILDTYGMKPAFDIFNAICVEDLGFDSSIFPSVQFNPQLKERVLQEILFPKFKVGSPSNLLKRIPYKLKRWRANQWKHKLCYNDSLWSAFWSGVWNHILKPSSI